MSERSVVVVAAAVGEAGNTYAWRDTLGARDDSSELNAAPAASQRCLPS